MDYKERRALDILQTDKLAKFIDTFVYPILKEKITRINDRDLQLRGVDLKGDEMYVDEKCAIKYINKDLQTFAFELSALNNRHESGGFLNKEHNLTDAYLLGYLQGDIMQDEYQQIELLLVKKSKVWEYLNQYNFEARIDLLIKDIRSGALKPTFVSEGGIESFAINDIPDIKITRSTKLSESPINIVIRKSLLLKLCSKGIVYENKKTTYKDFD